jgi:Lantibiotic dehydratase, N terminus
MQVCCLGLYREAQALRRLIRHIPPDTFGMKESESVAIETQEADVIAADTTRETTPPVLDHLVPFADKEWALWKCVGLRSTGFPAKKVLALSAGACAEAADFVIAAEAELSINQNEALIMVNKALDKIKAESNWDDAAKRDPLVKALRLLKAGKVPDPVGVEPDLAVAIKAIHCRQGRIEEAESEFRKEFASSAVAASLAIRELAQEARFREAITWQNRGLLDSALAPILRRPPGDAQATSKHRQKEQLIASYLQRYCVKNDTIGFFGPVGWAELNPSTEGVSVRPGPTLLAARNLYFEVWCIEALSDAFGKGGSLDPWLAPRRMSFIGFDHDQLRFPHSFPIKISAQEAAALKLCSGDLKAKDIAALLVAQPELGFKSDRDVYKVLARLRDKGLVAWHLEVPIELYPEQFLEHILNGVEANNVRLSALESLMQLRTAFQDVQRAAGDTVALDNALGNLETTFSRLTGAPANRSAGQMYAGRTLVYEDCRRDVEVELGLAIQQAIEKPLSLLLTSARWFTYQTAQIYNGIFKDIYAELSEAAGSPVVDFVSFWYRARPRLLADGASIFENLQEELQERWWSILRPPPEERSVTYSSDRLRPDVLSVFAAPGPGWQSARYHSPDLLIAAPSLDAIRKGDWEPVLGELHIGVNTLSSRLFMAQHRRPQELKEAIGHDLPGPRLSCSIPKSYWPNQSSRLMFDLVTPRDYRLEFMPGAFGVPGSRTFPIGDLVVEECAGELFIGPRAGEPKFELIEAFADFLTLLVSTRFKLLRHCRHLPRIYMDRLVVCREAWCFPASELSFAGEKDEARRFIEARRWAQDHAMPRFVFIKAPVEVKPFYVDFESPVFVSIFAKVVRRTREMGRADQTIAVTEMLPGVDEVWLPDNENNLYANELRVVAVDRMRDSPGAAPIH